MTLEDIKYKWLGRRYAYCDNKANKKYLKQYSDYEVNNHNLGSMKFIWGITSWDNLSGTDANLYTMNDIDIIYDRDTKKYGLSVETIYMFEGDRKQEECKYLVRLLGAFTKFMDDNGYDKNYDLCLCCVEPVINNKAYSIEELYINFKIFVEGYCKVGGYEEC